MALKNKPASSVLVIDEAYIHMAPYGKNCTHMVAADKGVVLRRTLSKLYGMAGLRAGAAIARPDLLAGITQFGAGALPVTAMVGVLVSFAAARWSPISPAPLLAWWSPGSYSMH